MDYSQLSDFEINKLVARALDGLHGDDRTAVDCYLPTHNSNAVSIPDGDIGWIHPDYCNKPADAWPIIVDNEISLNSYSGTWEASYEYDAPIGAFGTDEIVTQAVEGKNPLRTAMIAFLMKQEHQNA